MNRWTEYAKELVEAHAENIKFFIADEISKEKAIEIEKAETTLSEKYWKMVLDKVNEN